jgi:hypothetical protein
MASLTLPGFIEPLDFVSHAGRTEYVNKGGDAGCHNARSTWRQYLSRC